MPKFDLEQLRLLRKAKSITATELARRMQTSPAQIHRLEKGLRRLTVETLIDYCDALDISIETLFSSNIRVAITGVIDSDFEVQPLPQNAANTTLAPPINADMQSIAALRWEASRRFQPMLDHIVFYRHSEAGLAEFAWNKRCLVTRRDGSQCLGWPIKDNQKAHIDVGDGPAEFNVDIVAAAPVIAVMPPFAIQDMTSLSS